MMELNSVSQQKNFGTTLGKVRQHFASLAVTIGIFSLGCVLGYTSPALPDIEKRGDLGKITYSQKAWVGSLSMLGALMSATVAGVSVEKIGRKKTIIAFAVPFIAGWIIIGSSPSITWVYIGRFITGLAGGTLSLAVPIFISEISEDKIRGLLSSYFQLMMVSGILFVYIVGAYVPWSTLAYICCAFPATLIPMTICLPETPRFLLSKGRFSEAARALAWLRGTMDTELIQDELSQVKQSVAESKEQNIGLKDAFSPAILKPMLICLSLMVFEQISGFNAVIFYTVDIFKAAGSQIDSNLATIIVGIVQVLATIVSCILVDRAGRRVLLIFGQVVMSISLFALGLFFYLKYLNDGISPRGLSWLPIVSLLVFLFGFAQGIGPLSWTMMGEILPPNLKGFCCSIATSLVWFSGFLVTVGYEHLLALLGIYWCFWLFSIFCVIGLIVVTAFVPETKGRSLEEIQSLFTKNSSQRRRVTYNGNSS